MTVAGPALTDDTRDAVRARFARVAWFAPLDADEMDELAASVTVREFAAGDTIVREGDPGDAMFVILEGQVEVAHDANGTAVFLARLGAGDVFGEMALVTGDPRNASVTSDGPSRVAAISRERFEALVRARPELDDEIRRVVAVRLAEAPRPAGGRALAVLSGDGPIRIGSESANEVVLADPGIAAVHATLISRDGQWVVVDGGSATGTLLNRNPIHEAPLAEGDTLRLASVRLYLRDRVLYRAPAGVGVAVESRGLGVRIGERDLLTDVDVSIEPGELVAIVGPSGAGKSTLLNALIALVPRSAGEVLYGGVPIAQDPARLRSILGYVPQYDIVHQELTVRESLRFAAGLRLPPGTLRSDVDQRIAGLLHRLHLELQADLLVGKLSGGQRKRACIAAELLTDPGVVFLDEPTSGLDPGLDAALMLQLRELADEGRTIVITTHATRNIRLCDRVIAVNRGHVVFDGSPGEALDHFKVDDFADVYAALGGDPREGVERYRESPAFRRRDALHALHDLRRESRDAGDSSARPRTLGAIGQFGQLVRRNARLLSRDRVNLALRLAGAPILAAILTGSFEAAVFEPLRADGGNAQQAVILLYLACAITLFLGAFTSANAITGEAGVFRRERLVGLSPAAYVFSKVAVAAAFAIFQGFLFIAVLSLKVDFPSPTGETLLQLGALLALVSFAGATMGMLISAVSANADRAAILVILALIPQLIFAGATIPKSEMSPVSSVASQFTTTKWGLELGGSITGLEDRLAAQSVQRLKVTGQADPVEVQLEYRPYEGAFAISEASRWAVLAGFSILFSAATVVVQVRKDSRTSLFRRRRR
ncbi:MAG: ATP-binding cassette domain-containing protein [Chloroflexi bacterium]|nr:ATP-binding cassette domain-containing protein [Chloroflexota bacterium]